MIHPKKYIVVGATNGLGKVFAYKKLEEGHQVAILGRKLTEKISSDKAQFFPIELLDRNNRKKVIENVLKWQNGIHHLIFCQRSRESNNNLNKEMEVGLHATHHIMELCRSHFLQEVSPSVVAVSSIASRFILSDTVLEYHTSKAALENLIKWYGVNWGKYNIRVNAVVPGAVIKPESQNWYDQNPQVVARKTKLIPLNRIAKAKEIAEIIDFLCSEKSSIITGQTIVADGGMSLMGHESISKLLN